MNIIDPEIYREFGRCFYLIVPVCETEEEFLALMEDADRVCNATKKMLSGSIDIEELIESVEQFVPSIDDYLEEVEENMEEALIKIYKY